MAQPRVLVIGGGISGLAAAVELVGEPGRDARFDVARFDVARFDVARFDVARFDVEVWEGAPRLGGKIATSPFASLPNVDEGADAFLRRVPAALEFTRRIGIPDDQLLAPEPVGAAVYHDRLTDIPSGVLLGVPASIKPFITTDLLSWRGKLRAGVEPFLPRTDPDDSIGRLIRRRFGNEVHERLVDALIGSIYATDTDRSSLRAVPQLDQLAAEHRSLLIGARATKRRAASMAPISDPPAPIFAAPPGGMGAVVSAAATYLTERGAIIHTDRPVTAIERDGRRWRVDDQPFDAIVIATPARAASALLAPLAPDASAGLASIETADVIMLRLAVPAAAWPERLRGRSGYLVSKPAQKTVTAVSFGSQKWAHWRPDNGDQILRVSLGRDGLAVRNLTDAQALNATIEELTTHLGVVIEPSDVFITRWMEAFPQYRPHHHDRIAAIETSLPNAMALAGASYRGIGIPACIADGRRAAKRLVEMKFGRGDEH